MLTDQLRCLVVVVVLDWRSRLFASMAGGCIRPNIRRRNEDEGDDDDEKEDGGRRRDEHNVGIMLTYDQTVRTALSPR